MLPQRPLSEYRYRIELHAHSKPLSSCSEVTAPQLVDLYKSLGFDALVLTNHFLEGYLLKGNYPADKDPVDHYLSDYYLAKKRGDEVGLRVYLGCEPRFYRVCNRDYLLYGITEEDIPTVYAHLTSNLQTFYRSFHNDRNLVFAAHPFRDIKQPPLDLSCVDGLEVFNMHPGHNQRIATAAAFARGKSKLISCGSDFHHPHLPGNAGGIALRTHTLPADSLELAALLKTKDYFFDVFGAYVFPYAGEEE